MQTPHANVYEFGSFQLDPAKRRLKRLDGTSVPLTPRVFDTLLYMVEHHDSVLDKEQIMEAVWPDSIVEENNLAQAISKLRQVFGETPGSHNYIVTVPGRGYRFVADITKRSDDAACRSKVEDGGGKEPIEKPALISLEVPTIQRPRTPWPRSTNTAWLWAFALSAIVVAIVIGLFSVRHRSLPAAKRAPSSPVPVATASSMPAVIPEKSVAVLPFDNLSDERENAYFAAGVQDEITTNLAKIAELKVISRTSANLYKSGNPRNSREIAQQLGDEAGLLVDDGRGPVRLHLLPHVDPDAIEVLEVGEDVILRSILRRRADDDAPAESMLLAEGLDDAAQPVPLVPGLDLARYADVIDGRHEHEEPPGERGMRGEPRPFRAQRLLDDLDQDLLAFAEQIRDRRLVPLATRLPAIPTLIALAALALAASFRRRWRRSHNLLLLLDKLYRLSVVIMAITFRRRRIRFCCGSGWSVLAWASSSSTTTTGSKLTARLTLEHSCFRVGVTGNSVRTSFSVSGGLFL